MTEDFHRALRESLGAYVLGHLDPAEEDAVRVHLATCDECRAELAELQPVANALAIARHRPVTGAVTPRSLQRRVSDAVAAEAGRRRRSRLVTSLTTLDRRCRARHRRSARCHHVPRPYAGRPGARGGRRTGG
ncbi:MAG: zf-HC2 domain-containing protein [Geodermatophilaceae bacterium]